MEIYLMNIVLVMFYAYLFLYKEDKYSLNIRCTKSSHQIENFTSYKKKLFVFFASLQWILISGLRDLSVGSDTGTYLLSYRNTKLVSWEAVWKNFISIYFNGGEGKDGGYMIFEKITMIFTDNYQIYLIIIALVFFIPFAIFIYKNSNEPMLSFLLFSTLFYAFFAITGLRQTIATALVVLIGYGFIKERKLLPFLVLIMIAFTIHKSSIIFLPFYWIANIKMTKNYISILVVISSLLFVFKYQFSQFLKGISGYDKDYGINPDAGTGNFTFILILLTIIALWRIKIVLANNPQAVNYYNALFLALIFTPTTWVNPSAMRIVQYFSLFLVLLVPEIVKSFDEKEKPIVYFVVITVLVGLFTMKNPHYLFFWQGV